MRRREQLVGIVRVISSETSVRDVAVIGDQPEALLLSVLFADAGVGNVLVGPFEPLSGRVFSSNPVDQARRLLGLHVDAGRVAVVDGLDSSLLSGMKNIVLTSHVRGPDGMAAQERVIRAVSKSVSAETNIVVTGLCRPGYSATVGSLVAKMAGLASGMGVCYAPLLWDGEGLAAFRETPRILACGDPARLQYVQELFLRLFPALMTIGNVRAAEAAGLFGPVFREVSGALELELAGVCAGEGVDYSEILGLCRRTSLSGLGSLRLFSGRGSIATEIAAGLGRGQAGPSLVRTARRVNGDLDRRIIVMVKGALARCGLRVRHSRIAVLGLDGLGANAGVRPEQIGLLQALNRRGAIVSVYPGSGVDWSGTGSGRVSVERSIVRAVERAQCAVVALEGSEMGELNPFRLAAEMSRPAALCDLTGSLEASNVERAGLLYASIGRGSLEG